MSKDDDAVFGLESQDLGEPMLMTCPRCERALTRGNMWVKITITRSTRKGNQEREYFLGSPDLGWIACECGTRVRYPLLFSQDDEVVKHCESWLDALGDGDVEGSMGRLVAPTVEIARSLRRTLQ